LHLGSYNGVVLSFMHARTRTALSAVVRRSQDDSRFRRDLDRLVPQLIDTAHSMRAMSDLLSRHPEALTQGRTNVGKK